MIFLFLTFFHCWHLLNSRIHPPTQHFHAANQQCEFLQYFPHISLFCHWFMTTISVVSFNLLRELSQSQNSSLMFHIFFIWFLWLAVSINTAYHDSRSFMFAGGACEKSKTTTVEVDGSIFFEEGFPRLLSFPFYNIYIHWIGTWLKCNFIVDVMLRFLRDFRSRAAYVYQKYRIFCFSFRHTRERTRPL